MPDGGDNDETIPACPPGGLMQSLRRVLPLASYRLVRQCKPHQVQYFRERGLREADGFFLADAPCRHLRREEPDNLEVRKWVCDIYDRRPATCRDYCGRSLSGGKRYYVPEGCTMADEKSRE